MGFRRKYCANFGVKVCRHQSVSQKNVNYMKSPTLAHPATQPRQLIEDIN
jgi:hypothetical protein